MKDASPIGLFGAEEELGTVGVWTAVRHAQNACKSKISLITNAFSNLIQQAFYLRKKLNLKCLKIICLK